MISALAAFIEGAARKLLPVDFQIVSPGNFGVDPETATGATNHIHLPFHVKIRLRQQKGEIEVARIVKDGTAAGKAAGKAPALLFQKRHAAFFECVLIPSDNDRSFILPQIQNHTARGTLLQKNLLACKVFKRIGRKGTVNVERIDHALFQRSTGFRAARTSSGRAICALCGDCFI